MKNNENLFGRLIWREWDEKRYFVLKYNRNESASEFNRSTIQIRQFLLPSVNWFETDALSSFLIFSIVFDTSPDECHQIPSAWLLSDWLYSHSVCVRNMNRLWSCFMFLIPSFVGYSSNFFMSSFIMVIARITNYSRIDYFSLV